jgi:hypothetical protein
MVKKMNENAYEKQVEVMKFFQDISVSPNKRESIGELQGILFMESVRRPCDAIMGIKVYGIIKHRSRRLYCDVMI